MTDVKRSDRKAALLSFLNPRRFAYWLLAIGIGWLFWATRLHLLSLGTVCIASLVFAYYWFDEFKILRWKNSDHRTIWNQIRERYFRLKHAMRKAPDFARESLLPTMGRIEQIRDQLYSSLRKADLVKAEIVRSESNLTDPRLRLGAPSSDLETNQLYSLADKNIAEYRKHYEVVASRVTRVEAQCAVFSSALDALRMKLLGYRLLSKDQPQPASDFGQAVNEINSQLAGIDLALKELEIYPEMHPQADDEGKISAPPP
ncbi:MAG: hypothetical protein U0R49_11400 [Fimbriimonadales bacterium]